MSRSGIENENYTKENLRKKGNSECFVFIALHPLYGYDVAIELCDNDLADNSLAIVPKRYEMWRQAF